MVDPRTFLLVVALVGAVVCVAIIGAGELATALHWLRRRTVRMLRPEAVHISLAQAELGSITTEFWVLLRLAASLLAGLMAWVWFALPVLGVVAFAVVYHLAGVALEARRRQF